MKLVIAKRRDRSLRNILNTPYVTFGAFTGIRTKAVRVEVRVSSISIKEEKPFRRGVLDPLLAVGYFRPRLKLRKIRSRDVVSRARGRSQRLPLKKKLPFTNTEEKAMQNIVKVNNCDQLQKETSRKLKSQKIERRSNRDSTSGISC